MKRQDWLNEKRIMAEKRYDSIFSIDYDKNWGNIEKIHEETLEKFLKLIIPNGKILDAACGTGKYYPIISSKNFNVLGIDQSQKMLKNANCKFPLMKTKKLGLQEISFNNEFDGIICIDALENVFPEHLLSVFQNFYKALKPNGYFYFTIETLNDDEINIAFEKGIEMGLPIVKGEYILEGGYHYYPSIDEIKTLLISAKFNIFSENMSEGYHHFIVSK